MMPRHFAKYRIIHIADNINVILPVVHYRDLPSSKCAEWCTQADWLAAVAAARPIRARATFPAPMSPACTVPVTIRLSATWPPWTCWCNKRRRPPVEVPGAAPGTAWR